MDRKILVSLQTTLLTLFPILKIKAIVTDEGKVRCQAAIIARKCKIPCLIATNAATKILKDGDWIEVDAKKV